MADKVHLSNGNPAAANKYRTHLTIKSVQNKEQVEHTVDADVYCKGNHIYIRYEEPILAAEGDRSQAVKRRSSSAGTAEDQVQAAPVTNVMLKLSADEWKLTRRGDVESEMSFAPNMRLNGYYRSAALRFPLVTNTKQWTRRDRAIEQNGVIAQLPEYVAWAYDLYIEEDCVGQFALALTLDWSSTSEREQ
ncbi:DUF1934 domain-containing protein [Paenibacillus assamensis]|uniref:DUF1934 domain-containing protein n=1 Tax=Paenibacillus assamensis TaxID=311244 RepID=UPI000405FFBC|nr:DUF1934 domain-containing protein [Paenibacillus assamensis]